MEENNEKCDKLRLSRTSVSSGKRDLRRRFAAIWKKNSERAKEAQDISPEKAVSAEKTGAVGVENSPQRYCANCSFSSKIYENYVRKHLKACESMRKRALRKHTKIRDNM